MNAELKQGNFKERSWFSKHIEEPLTKYIARNVFMFKPSDSLKLTGGWIVPMSETGTNFSVSETNADIMTFCATGLFAALKLTYTSRITTPYGDALQSTTKEAIAAKKSVKNGATIYRGGTIGISETGEAQFWSLENPLSPDYASKMGIPIENYAKPDFIERGKLKFGTKLVTREAPPVGINSGGGIEVVVPRNGVNLEVFNTLE